MNYLTLLEHSYSMVAQIQEAPPGSRLEYLSQHIFDFTTYESDAGRLFARRAVEVCAAVSDGKTFEYIANDEGRIWYLLMVNMPFFAGRLEWGSSIRGAWWADPVPLDSCGLFVGDKQQTAWEFSRQEWESFVRAIIAFAQPEMDHGDMANPLNKDQLTDDQIEALRHVRIFEGMDPNQFRWLVRRVEFEHRIGDAMGLEEAGIVRIKDGWFP